MRAVASVLDDNEQWIEQFQQQWITADRAWRTLSQEPAIVRLPELDLDGVDPLAMEPLHTLAGRSLYPAQVRELIAPIGGLIDREDELAMLTRFCEGQDRYLWIRADPWAGKSALLSSFLLDLDPQPGVTVVGFFITARLADQNDHRAFTDAVLDHWPRCCRISER